MMRLARRASLLVAFGLLTSAATTYAECAWVLWEDMIQSSKNTSTEPVRAYTTKEDCDRVNLPRFGRHPRSHESAVGVVSWPNASGGRSRKSSRRRPSG